MIGKIKIQKNHKTEQCTSVKMVEKIRSASLVISLLKENDGFVVF